MANNQLRRDRISERELTALLDAVLMNHPQTGHLLFDSFQVERLVPGLYLEITAAGLHGGDAPGDLRQCRDRIGVGRGRAVAPGGRGRAARTRNCSRSSHIERCEPFSAFSSEREGRAGSATDRQGCDFVFSGAARGAVLPSLMVSSSRTCLGTGFQRNRGRASFPDIPFLGIHRVIYMKKSVDPQFRSR